VPAATGVQSEPRSVLVLYGERAELPAIVAVHGGLDAALRADKEVDKFSEFLDFARFPAPSQREELMRDIVSDGERAGEVIRGIREMVRKGKAIP
jgi:hypothetical protein